MHIYVCLYVIKHFLTDLFFFYLYLLPLTFAVMLFKKIKLKDMLTLYKYNLFYKHFYLYIIYNVCIYIPTFFNYNKYLVKQCAKKFICYLVK